MALTSFRCLWRDIGIICIVVKKRIEWAMAVWRKTKSGAKE